MNTSTGADTTHLEEAAAELRHDDPLRPAIELLFSAMAAQETTNREVAETIRQSVAKLSSVGNLTDAQIDELGQRCARAVGGMAQSELRQAAKRWLHDGLLVMAVVNAVFLLTGIAIGLSAVYLAEAPPGFTCADKPDGSRFCWKWTRLPPNHHD